LIYLGIIVFVVIIGLAMVGIFSIIEDGQELSEINISVQEKNNEITSELINIKGTNTNTGSIEFTNTQNEEIKIIQVRVYDDNGEYVGSFEIDEIVSGNSEIEISNLPQELQEMLVD